MGANLRTIGRMVKTYAKMDLLWFLRDMRICLLYMFSDSVLSLSGVFGMLLVADRLGPAVSMSRPELVFMLGCALLVDGVYWLLFMSNNAGAISRIIGRGQLDHALIQPVPLPIHFFTNGVAPITGSGPFLCGLALTGWAVAQLETPLIPWWPLVLAGLLLLALAIETAWVFGISAIAFRAPYAAEEIAPEVTGMFASLSPYPLGGFGQGLQLFLCGVLPVGSIAWLPASILLGRVPTLRGGGFLALCAAVFVLLALFIFRKGLNYYAKNSCPRYSGFGR